MVFKCFFCIYILVMLFVDLVLILYNFYCYFKIILFGLELKSIGVFIYLRGIIVWVYCI